MSTAALPPPSSSHITDRYLFRSLSNDNNPSRSIGATRKNKLPNVTSPSSGTTPPAQRKRYKFSSTVTDQNNNNIYKFPNGHAEARSHSTDSNRYYFPSKDSLQKTQQTLTYVRSGNGPEQRSVTFIGGTPGTNDKILSPSTKSIQPTTLIPDTPYLFPKTSDSPRHPSGTSSSVNPEDLWLQHRQKSHIVFDSTADASPASQLKRTRTSSSSPEHQQTTRHRSPTRMDTVTSTNGSLSTIRRSPPNKIQNVRFDPSSTISDTNGINPRSYLNEARERLAGKKRGQSPEAFLKSVDRLVTSTNNKYRQQQILSPPIPFQQLPVDYVSQYYAHEDDEPPIDYSMDSDDDDDHQQQKRSSSAIYTRGLNSNRTHGEIMKNVNKSLIDRNYLSDTNRLKQLDHNVRCYLRYIENQALQRELNHDLIRCFSSTYLDDVRREENRHFQTRRHPRSYTYEDIQDIQMPSVLEAYRMKTAVDRERRLRLTNSFDGQHASSTPTSSLGAGQFSPLLSFSSPIMSGSLNENMDAQSGGFEIDRRSHKTQHSTSHTPTNLRPGHMAPGSGLDLFYEIMHDRFRGVDASIAGQVSNASQYTKQKMRHPANATSQNKPTDNDSDVDVRSNLSLWSDDDDEQQPQEMLTNQPIPHQRQISRYLSTVNRSLLDRPSDLIADFYISQLNRSMQDSVRNVETIARDKARVRQNRNREFIDETSSKLGRSLSAEHLYQVRKEHLRYRQPFTNPTSFTVEDVADIYKPFVLENYKRKIAIELERRRRQRQEQLMGFGSPAMSTSNTELGHVIKLSPPPILEIPVIPIVDPRTRLSRSAILRTNEPGSQFVDDGHRAKVIIVPSPVVTQTKVPIAHARRTLTDDGSADVVHHIGIISPPASYSMDTQPSPRIRTTITTSITDHYQQPQISIVPPPDFSERDRVLIRQERAKTNIILPATEEMIDGPLSSSQQVLFQSDDYDASLRRPVQIVTSTSLASPRSQTQIYTHSPQTDTIRVCQADLIESNSGNYGLSMANVRSVVTLNHGEVNELNLVAQQAQRLQLAPHDYDRAMIILSPDQTHQQHHFDRQPLLLAAARINQLHEEPNEQVLRHIEQEQRRQRTQLITPMAEHMARMEHEIPVFENISMANLSPPSRNKLNEMPNDSGIVSLNTSQTNEQPMIFNAARTNRLDPSDEIYPEKLPENDYYRRRLRAFDLLRQVEIDPNANIQPIERHQVEIFESVAHIPNTQIPRENTRMIGNQQLIKRHVLEHTDEPVIYETIDQNMIHRIPPNERLSALPADRDQPLNHRVKQNPVIWSQRPSHQSKINQLDEIKDEQTIPLLTGQQEQTITLRSKQEQAQPLEPPKRSEKNTIYSYGENKEIHISRTSSFGSDQELKRQYQTPARVEYDRRILSTLDDITQPISHHPPARTHRDQQHIAQDIDDEPMAVREEMALENDVSFEGSLGRASINRPFRSLNAPKSLAESNTQALLLEELPTAAHEQHATKITDDDDLNRIRLTKVEETPRLPMIVYDTDWQDGIVQTIPTLVQPRIENAHHKYPANIPYEQAEIRYPRSILSREQHKHVDKNNEEIVQIIQPTTIASDQSIERIQDKNELVTIRSVHQAIINDNQTNDATSEITDLYEDPLPLERSTEGTSDSADYNYQTRSQSLDQILCHPLDNHLDNNPSEQIDSLSDDSLLVRHQHILNTKSNETTLLENPLRSTATLTLSFPRHNQEINPPWQRVFDQHFTEHQQQSHETLHLQTQPNSPRFLPSISFPANERTLTPSETYASEFQQTPLLHENVRIDNSDSFPLQSSTQIHQSQPVYRVRQYHISPTDDHNYASISSILPTQAKSHVVESISIQPPANIVGIEVRVRPTHSETSSLLDMDSFLNRFEDSLEPEQHLPLIDQISLSYTTTLRPTPDDTKRAIERYEEQHPYFSRSLPLEWFQPQVLPHDEQLMEQWIVEKNLDTIQQQQEYIRHEPTETTIITTNPLIESTTFYPTDRIDRTEQARQRQESFHLESLPEQNYVEINIATPTPSMRKVHPPIPSRPGTFLEDLSMERTVNANLGSHLNQHIQRANYRQVNEHDATRYAATTSREQPDHLPVKHLPVQHTPGLERARLIPNSTVLLSDDEKSDQVVIRESVVQHVSEDEKSTSSEEVIFEEWSEEFLCRRTDEIDQRTNRLLRTTIDETSERVKSDVIKEEYKEKNERIKGHKSYDIVKDVYRRVPAHTIDSNRTTVIPIDRPKGHVYEEISQTPLSTVATTSSSSVSTDRLPSERPSRDRHWSSEDIYTTEIVYDSDLAREYESIPPGQRPEPKTDSSSIPPALSRNYDRVRPGQYPAMPSASQATLSTVPSSNYDRISSLIPPSTHYADRRGQDREEVVSEEYLVEVEQRRSDRHSPQTSKFDIHQREETSEEDASDSYRGLTTIINEAGQRQTSTGRTSDWRNKLKQAYAPISVDDRFDQSSRSRDITKKSPSIVRLDDDRPIPPKRSSSSSSIIDERRARFEQQQQDTTVDLSTDKSDRLTFGRVGELKNAFESPINGSTKDDAYRYRTPISTGITEERRKLFEQQQPSIIRRSANEYHSDERRMSETHTGPSRVTSDRISPIESAESKSTARVQSTDRLGRNGFDQIKSSLESSMGKTSEPSVIPQTSIDITIKNKQVISSIDSDVSGPSRPIYQSTPKSIKQTQDDDAGHESEDELSDPTSSTRKQEQHQDTRRRISKTRLRDFSQSTSQPIESNYTGQRTRSTFNEENMENMLSHLPASKGKALLIELSPRPSHETPITSTTTKPIRDPHKSIIGSDSGIFEYSSATSHHPTTSSSSWRHNASSSYVDDANRTSTLRDSGIHADSTVTPTASSRYGRRQTSDTDQTTIHGGDDSVSRSTYRYDTEIVPNDSTHQQQRYIRRQITRSPPSEYENIANYHSGVSSQRKVPITTQSRSIGTKPLVVDEIETIETETRVECQVQRTHEIKESTTKTARAGSPHTPKKIITTTTTTTTTTHSPETSSDEAMRTLTPAKRVLLNERPQYYDSTKINGSPLTVRSPPESTYTPTNDIRQGIRNYHEREIIPNRFDSPQSDSISYSIPPPVIQSEDPIRVEETWFKPIQRDRSQDSLLQSPTSRSNIRTLSNGPRTMEITSLSPQTQVTFGKYAPNEIIAIVRVPELSNGTRIRPSPLPPQPTTSSSSTIRHGTSEPELNIRAAQDEERARLHYQRVHATSYRPPPTDQDYQTRPSRSRTGPYDRSNDYSSPINPHTRSSSYHSVLHEQDRQQQQGQYIQSPSSGSAAAYHHQAQRRSGSLGNLFGANIEFEIEIEKRPPQQPERPTTVALDQATRAIVTTSKDGRVSIQNVAARPGNTVVINSDFHSSDRSLNRSSGYFSSDELRSQGLTANYSSDEQSSGAGIIPQQTTNTGSTPSHTLRQKNNEQNPSKLPAHYRSKQNHYQHLNNDSFDRVNQIVHRYYQQSKPIVPNTNSRGFNEAIDQIDALYNNLDIQTNEDYFHDRLISQQPTDNTIVYDFSKPSTTASNHRRQQLSHNANEYTKRYTSTGFQNMSSHTDQPPRTNGTLNHLVSPPTAEKRRSETVESHRALSDNENINRLNQQTRPWGSTSLNDLVAAGPIRPSQSLSSSGILTDYATPGSISPNSGFGSTQNVIVQQNRLNGQSQVVQRNRTSVKQMKQKSAAKKKFGTIQGQFSDEEYDNDSAGGHDSPLSDNGHPPVPSRFSNFSQRHQ